MNDNDIMFFKESFETAISVLDEYGLKIKALYISFPEAKTNYIEIPFSSIPIDLTEVDGNIYYKQREVTIELDYVGGFSEFRTMTTKLASYLHGKHIKAMDTTDSGFYYDGRWSIDGTKTDPVMGTVFIKGIVDPYKYELSSGSEEWLWDPFDFETGVVREYGNVRVPGSLNVIITGTEMAVIPTIICSVAMSVNFEGKTYNLAAGTNKIYGICLKQGENALTFSGNGIVSIDYRGGWL